MPLTQAPPTPKQKKDGFLAYKSKFFRLSKKRQNEFIDSLSPEEAIELKYCTDFWLRKEQVVSGDDWRYWLFQAGRGTGKTLTGAAWFKKCVYAHKTINGRDDVYALVGPTHKDVSQTMVPALIALFPENEKPVYNKTAGEIKFHNGAVAYCYSSEVEIRGPNIAKCWADELAKWYDADKQFGILIGALRVGDSQQMFISTTAKKHIKTLRNIEHEFNRGNKLFRLVIGCSQDNVDNLGQEYIEDLKREYGEGTKRYRQEVLGELLDDSEDSLFSQVNFDTNRVAAIPEGVRLQKVIVSVDPAGSNHEGSDETGIIVAALGSDGFAYVLKDASGRYSPEGWAKRVSDLSIEYSAHLVIAEKNFGGDMVASTIRAVNPRLSVKLVHASKNKEVRAQPVSAQYAQNRVKHVGDQKRLEKLEDQMSCFVDGPSTSKRKDDRVDALVWAITELIVNKLRSVRNLRNFHFFQ